MGRTYSNIQELLHQKADFQSQLKLIHYDGNPEIKDWDYLYIRKRIGSWLTPTYVNTYTDEIYQLLLCNTWQAKKIRKVKES